MMSVGRRGSMLVHVPARAEEGGNAKAGGIIATLASGVDKVVLFGGGVRGNSGSLQSQRRHGHSGMLVLEGAIETAWPFWRQQQSALAGPGGQQHRRFERVTQFDDTDSTAVGVAGRRLSATIPHPHARTGANNPSAVETARISETSGRSLRPVSITSCYSPWLHVVNWRGCSFDFQRLPRFFWKRTASAFSATNWLDAPDRFSTKTQRSSGGHQAVLLSLCLSCECCDD